MNSEQFEKFKYELNTFNSTHIKVANIERDNETGIVTLEIIQMPRGLRFRIEDMFLGNPSMEAGECLKKADGMIKNEAIKDVVSWIMEKKNFDKCDIKQFTVLVEPGIPDDIIIMNHKTFLDFREATEKYHGQIQAHLYG